MFSPESGDANATNHTPTGLAVSSDGFGHDAASLTLREGGDHLGSACENAREKKKHLDKSQTVIGINRVKIPRN